jgi:hypothetical protein
MYLKVLVADHNPINKEIGTTYKIASERKTMTKIKIFLELNVSEAFQLLLFFDQAYGLFSQRAYHQHELKDKQIQNI